MIFLVQSQTSCYCHSIGWKIWFFWCSTCGSVSLWNSICLFFYLNLQSSPSICHQAICLLSRCWGSTCYSSPHSSIHPLISPFIHSFPFIQLSISPFTHLSICHYLYTHQAFSFDVCNRTRQHMRKPIYACYLSHTCMWKVIFSWKDLVYGLVP